MPLDDIFKIDSSSQNKLEFTECEWRIGRGKWQSTTPISVLLQNLKDRNKDFSAQFKFTFGVGMGFLTEVVMLCFESQADFEILVNDRQVEFAGTSVNITDYIKLGKNEIILTTPDFLKLIKANQNVLEGLYLVGDFALKNNGDYTYSDGKILTGGSFTLTSKSDSINSYKIRENGYWFFDGSITLSQSVFVDKKKAQFIKLPLKIFRRNMPKLVLTELMRAFLLLRLMKST